MIVTIDHFMQAGWHRVGCVHWCVTPSFKVFVIWDHLSPYLRDSFFITVKITCTSFSLSIILIQLTLKDPAKTQLAQGNLLHHRLRFYRF
jgi:hypothetical protein